MATSNGTGTSRRVNLADHEFRSTEDVKVYTDAAKQQLALLSLEIDTAAHDLYVQLAGSGGTFGDQVTARRLARKATKPLRQAAADLHAASQHAHGCWLTFQRSYSEQIHPSGGDRKAFQFNPAQRRSS
jgi:hypothetical protein